MKMVVRYFFASDYLKVPHAACFCYQSDMIEKSAFANQETEMLVGSAKYAMPWRSILIAPLASIPVMTIAGLGSSDAGMLSDLGIGLLFGVILGVPMSFFGIVMIGLPLYFLLQRFESLRWWIVCMAGALVPFLLFFNDAAIRTTLAAVVTGLSVGALAYALRPREIMKPIFEKDRKDAS